METTSENTPMPSMDHHLSFGDLRWLLAELPAGATLYAMGNEFYPSIERSHLMTTSFFLKSDYHEESDPVTVGEFREFLETLTTVHNSYYLWINVDCNNYALNGIRMNGNGSFTLSAVDPWA